jgi:hypothetical protein
MKFLGSTALAASLLAVLPAQRVPMHDGSDRQVVVLEIGDLLPEVGGPQPPAAPRSAGVATPPTEVQRLAAFVRTFVAPLAEAGADLQPLGDRHLVVLGSASQVAAVERLLAHAKTIRDTEFHVDMRLCEVPAAVFDRDVSKLLRKSHDTALPEQLSTVLDPEAARTLVATLRRADQVKVTQFPNQTTPSLKPAKLRLGKQLSYVRDFEVEAVDGAFHANPLVDVVFAGYDIDLICAEIRDGTIGVQMQLVVQEVERPIRKIQTTLPGTTAEVTVEVPRVTGCRGSQTVEMAKGATAVMAARKDGGAWLVTLMTLQHLTSPPAAFPVRR